MSFCMSHCLAYDKPRSILKHHLAKCMNMIFASVHFIFH